LTVVLERDGAYPAFETLLFELDRARAALAAGRERIGTAPSAAPCPGPNSRERCDPAPALEAFLARLYTDESALRRFLVDPRADARRAGLGEEACEALASIDRVGLELAVRSFAGKRSRASRFRGAQGFLSELLDRARRTLSG